MATLRDVPILKTGIEYRLSSGPRTFTREDLGSVVAAQGAPGVLSPRLGLGHVDQRFTPGNDADPSFGSVTNLRLDEAGHCVIADMEVGPEWLTEDIVASAFPARSVEAVVDKEIAGRQYPVVLTAVKLLGTTWPGISTLEDLREVLTAKEPPLLTASVEAESVMRIFHAAWATGTRAAWWVRTLHVDPFELIVDDGGGNLYRLPYTPGEDDVTFGEPDEVHVRYVAASGEPSGGGPVLAAFTNRDAERASLEPGGGMSLIESLRQEFGLPDDADEAAVLAAVKAARAESPEQPQPQPEPEGEPDEGTEPEEEEQPTPKASKGARQPVAASAEGVVTLDEGTYQQLQASAELGRKAHERQELEDRDRLLASAVEEGRIPPSRKEHYAKLYAADRDGTTQLIASLAPGLVPVDERGGQPAAADHQDDAYEAPDWLLPPEVIEQRQQAQEVK
jgi:hypothetical protein